CCRGAQWWRHLSGLVPTSAEGGGIRTSAEELHYMRTPSVFIVVALSILIGLGSSPIASADLSPESFSTDKAAYFTAFDENATITVTGLTECAGQTVELGAMGGPIDE